MALRRAGRDTAAARVLEPIRPDLDVIENGSYYRLLRLYQGRLPVDSLLPSSGAGSLEDVTVLYGVANWHRYNGRRNEARALLDRILGSPTWAAFGYLAAETDVARMDRR
jgi:hypothetical protein